MTLPLWFQVTTFAVLGGLLLVDLIVVARRPHDPSLKESSLWVLFYVGLAVAFAGLLALIGGTAPAGSFVAGWLTEYSLSVDNLFVFVLIMSRFAVPRGNQQKVLMMGIIVSLFLRGGCILVGAAAIERFSWVFYLFGAFLVYTAVQLARGSNVDEEYQENAVVRQARRVLPVSDSYDGARLITRPDGRRLFTPMVIVFLAIGSTDLLFALDSIPAIFGLTQDPFVVFTATLFALMGLRQLYFLLGGLLERLVYLSVGLSVILGFIGVKLMLEALHGNELEFLNSGEPVGWAPAIPIGVSLGVIVGVLLITTVASLLRSRHAPESTPTRATDGSVEQERTDPGSNGDPQGRRELVGRTIGPWPAAGPGRSQPPPVPTVRQATGRSAGGRPSPGTGSPAGPPGQRGQAAGPRGHAGHPPRRP